MLKLFGEQKNWGFGVSIYVFRYIVWWFPKGLWVRIKWNESHFTLAANGKSKLIYFSFKWTTFPITHYWTVAFHNSILFCWQMSFAKKWEFQVLKKDPFFVHNPERFQAKSIWLIDGKMQMKGIRLLNTIR